MARKAATQVNPEPAPRPRKSRKKWIVLGIVLVILALLGYGGYVVAKKMTGPAIGTIIQSAPDTAARTPVEQEEFDGTHFTFNHPITYIEQPTKANPGDIEDRAFLSTGMQGGYITIVLSNFAGTTLDDNPSYSLRNGNPTKYQRKTVVVKNEQVVIFTSNDGQQLQQSAFWLHQGKLLTFSLTGIANDPTTAQSEFLSMVESLTWK